MVWCVAVCCGVFRRRSVSCCTNSHENRWCNRDLQYGIGKECVMMHVNIRNGGKCAPRVQSSSSVADGEISADAAMARGSTAGNTATTGLVVQ